MYSLHSETFYKRYNTIDITNGIPAALVLFHTALVFSSDPYPNLINVQNVNASIEYYILY